MITQILTEIYITLQLIIQFHRLKIKLINQNSIILVIIKWHL